MTNEKVLENRLRRALSRRGFLLMKSRRRDPDALDFGGYMIIDADRDWVVDGGSPFAYSMNLADVEEWVKEAPIEAHVAAASPSKRAACGNQ